LDLVSLDGRRACAVLDVERPWRGHLLFIRRDLVEGFADGRRIMQVAWGEREVGLDWRSLLPDWVEAVHDSYAHIWRHIRIAGEADQVSSQA
jgi:hypothetical protein